MSHLKRICMIFLGMILLFGTACASETVLLETGETMEALAVDETMEETENKLQEDDSKALIYVYVCGQVVSPGVYPLAEGDRVYQAIEMAGGILSEGDATLLNLAERLVDGQKIYVPSYEEGETWNESAAAEEATTGLVNINQASKEMLMTLPGVGESKADAILTYRQEHGRFNSLEDLMNVPGIKEGVYAKIKDRISIN